MRTRSRKLTALFFLVVLAGETLVPGAAYALTSGPSQPEMASFEPAGTGDLVDLFTGDLKYNIPLMDVGGYPINLSYQSGTGMEDEASWVGAGWSLNPGAITRNLRGLPDDFNGDQVQKEYHRKPFKKVGGRLLLKPTIMGWEIGSGSLHVGVYKDNYYGIGAETGASLSWQLARNKKTVLTAGLGINSDTRDGLSITPSLSLSKTYDKWDDDASRSVSGSFVYNTRGGLKQVSLGASFSTSAKVRGAPKMNFSATQYFGQTYTPSITNNTISNGFTFSYDGGIVLFGVYIGPGGQGYVYNEKLMSNTTTAPAYGYMNYLNGRKNLHALLDFNREKDGVFIPSAPSIPIPVATQDFFVATSQAGSQQFRPHFGGSYVVFDQAHYNLSNNTKLGVTTGFGNMYKAGARVENVSGGANTNKWVAGNQYLTPAEPAFNVASNPLEEAVYFKTTGELAAVENEYLEAIGKEDMDQVKINTAGGVSNGPQTVSSSFKTRGPDQPIPAALKRNKRERRVNYINVLTAAQAKKYGLDKTINGEDRDQGAGGIRKPHHISEVSITDGEGKRMVYGIPVYNLTQQEVTFSVDKPTSTYESVRRSGLIGYVPENGKPPFDKGRDEMYSKETLPAYASSFLLTGVLSPDYVDVKGDGITDDDLGTAVKFNYSKLTDNYQWRAPYAANKANYNEGFDSDPKDDKGSYVYGKKEVWYLGSVESKTMVAVFETSPREDGLGVAGEHGGPGSVKLNKLDRIKLYSKADWVKHGASAVPIKTAHFEYDYSTYPAVPNNTNQPVVVNNVDLNIARGKLTLKKVYFTFGGNTRGISNPYEFEYDMRLVSSEPNLPLSNDAKEQADQYTERQQDRWGTYKHSWYNKLVLNGSTWEMKLNNSEFPYTLQDNDNTAFDERKLNGRLASKWQLNRIHTPTGGTISVEYEADDYAYVQNRRAMQMCFVKSVGNGLDMSEQGNGTGLIGARGFTIELPVEVTGSDKMGTFMRWYLTEADGTIMQKLAYKINSNINNQGRYEYIKGYAEIDHANCSVSTDGKRAFIALKPVNATNPVAKAAWQMLKSDLPQYAYDNYDNSNATSISDDFVAAIKSIVQSIKNVRETFVSFENYARGRFFSNTIKTEKSMVRLYSPLGKKMGGGVRVKKLLISDNWHEMTAENGKTASYGQVYDYETKDAAGKVISSGVAAYEPSIGNEENPFHEPIPYTEKVHWSATRYHFIERPFCESYFPAATVGYSKVTVTSVGNDYVQQGGIPAKHTGFEEHAFYTARDFPTQVDNMKLEQHNYENSLILKLFSSTYVKRVATSQGFKVELNDMHGKPKSVKIFNKGGDLVTSTETFYNVLDEQAETKALKNEVDVLGSSGNIATSKLGTDIELVSDVRESRNDSRGTSIGAYLGNFRIPIPFLGLIPIPFGGVNFDYSITTDSYHSVSTVKVVHKYGIAKKVRTVQNGSVNEAENLLWDGETGQVLLTRTQNEFDDHIYAFTYPAHMAERGMQGAYKYGGAIFTSFITGSNGFINTEYVINGLVTPGDELVSLDTEQKGWVISSTVGSTTSLRLIDAQGEFMAVNGRFMVLRSGRRNLAGAGVGTVVSLKDPRVKTESGSWKLELDVDKQIVDAKAVTWSDKWAVPVGWQQRPVFTPADCPHDCLRDFFWGAMAKIIQTGSGGTRRGLFSQQSNNESVGNLMLKYQDRPACYNLAGLPATSSAYYLHQLHTVSLPGGITRYEIRPGDVAQFGIFQIVFDEVSTEFNDLVNSNRSEAEMISFLDATPFPNGLRKFCFTPESYQYPGGDHVDDWCSDKLILRSIESCNNPRWPCDIQRCSYKNLIKWHLVAPPEHLQYVDQCVDPLTIPVNPYQTGVLGNWRPDYAMTYTVDREQKAGLPYQNGGTNIRRSGYYKSFDPFWILSSNGLQKKFQLTDPLTVQDPEERWIWASKPVYFDQKGNEIESIDALKRYSSALFGYQESVATAIAANARRNEIAFDGFEDYDFQLQQGTGNPCPPPRHFDWGISQQNNDWCAGGGCISQDQSHSGKSSYHLFGNTVIEKAAGNAAPVTNFLGYDASGRYKLLNNELAEGFRPIAGKKYLLSLWVYDGMDQTNTINGLAVTLNGQNRNVNNLVVPVVEGWKRLELEFVAGSTFTLQLSNTGGTVYIDDVRILPFDGQLSSFVYDDVTMRLMAQLDENNFATFYEYDDEGTPIRVKKETERGIMTIKENRQFFRKRN